MDLRNQSQIDKKGRCPFSWPALTLSTLRVPGRCLIFSLFVNHQGNNYKYTTNIPPKKSVFSPNYFQFTATKMGEGGTRREESETENSGDMCNRTCEGKQSPAVESQAEPSSTSAAAGSRSPQVPRAHDSSAFGMHHIAPFSSTPAAVAQVPALTLLCCTPCFPPVFCL